MLKGGTRIELNRKVIPSQVYVTIHIPEESRMISLQPGTILEREYKGEKVKVKVLKDGKSYSYNGKVYDNRGELVKKITKGKTAQFTTFFGLNKSDTPKKVKKNGVVSSLENTDEGIQVLTIDSHIRNIIKEEIRNYFRSVNS